MTANWESEIATERARDRACALAADSLNRDDPLGWFEPLYAGAGGDRTAIPWADLAPNPHVVDWFARTGRRGNGEHALVVGCGLGDDAEELARRGFDVDAFDISPTAITWCRQRFPRSLVRYHVTDLLASPSAWDGVFGFVLEVYTLQVLPPDLRLRATRRIADVIAPGGTLLVVCRGREPDDEPGHMPWPLTRADLDCFVTHGLREQSFEDFLDDEDPPARRFRAVYIRP